MGKILGQGRARAEALGQSGRMEEAPVTAHWAGREACHQSKVEGWVQGCVHSSPFSLSSFIVSLFAH
jgi:hypothetical protein